MPGLFKGPNAIAQQYADLTYNQINAGTSQSTAVLLCTLQVAARLCFLYNSLDQDVCLWLLNKEVATQNPELPNDYSQLTLTTNRMLWQEFPARYNVNFDSSAVPIYFDPGTRIYVSLAPDGQTIGGIPTGATTPATVGKFRILLA